MRLACIWSICLTLAVAGAAMAQGWTAFSPEGGRFRIEMPAPPKVGTTTISASNGTSPMTEAVVQMPGATYVASYIDYPDRVAMAHSSEVLLDRARDGMASGRTIRGERKLTAGRSAGREFVIVESNGTVNAVRLYWARNRLFTLAVTGRQGVETAPDTQRFLDSFAIIRPPSG